MRAYSGRGAVTAWRCAWWRFGVLGLGAALAACASASRHPDGPGISVNHSVAEGRVDPAGHKRDGEEGRVGPASTVPGSSPAETPPASSSGAGHAPDPRPLRMQAQWQYEIAYEGGKLTVLSVKPVHLTEPRVTPRQMGRFALEFWVGNELLERVRFDFPLLPAEQTKERGVQRSLNQRPAFDVSAVTTVLAPASPRVRRAVLVDRATGSRTELPWPPDGGAGE